MERKRLLGIVLIALLVISWGVPIYPDLLWFGKLHYSSVFWTMLLSKVGIGVAAWLLLMLIIVLNLWVAGRSKALARPGPGLSPGEEILAQFGLTSKSAGLLFGALALIISYVIAKNDSSEWSMILSFFHQQPFGAQDPIFHRDIGFFVFSLPFYLFLQGGLLVMIVFSAIVTIVWYLKNGAIQVTNWNELSQAQGRQVPAPQFDVESRAIKHLIFYGGLIVLLLAWGYRLKMYNLLYSTAGAAPGAGYTDIHVRLLAYGVMIFLSLAFALFLFISAFGTTGGKKLWLGAGIWLGAIVLLTAILPMAVEKIMVKPNELARETPYIAYNIRFTNKAYGLDRIKPVEFPVGSKLTVQDIKAHKATISNIRIWDKRPLLETYDQLQSIRLYYNFDSVDVGRYDINGAYREVMLSARELDVNQLPPQADTWVNRHLIYTHGYGLTMNPVNNVTSEGLPDLIVKDLPAVMDFNLKLQHPEIYYGQKTDDYVLVNTETKEFDYPKGDRNVYTHYQGTGGVPINSLFRRLLFSLEFMDPQILFTTSLDPSSRIMYIRRIDRRVRAIAPFLDYDGDPYLVVSNGRLYWIQDAYTTSNMYPYSARSYAYFNKGLNYIRNSVKVVIDAYSGDVSFYVIDQKDPIVRTYSSIFPGLFKPFSAMPADLKNHIRYPEDLFKIQASIYRIYHMKDVQVFYNQEDLWQIPDEIYGDHRQEIMPYYIILRLPKEKREEFVLMLPFTPSKKDNMIAWLAARCDLPGYGNLIVYTLPKDKLIFGPMQIEARVDQQPSISSELTLWGQRGSTVIRGNLLVIPIGDTFIYAEPVYLVANQMGSGPLQSAFPQPTGPSSNPTGVSMGNNPNTTALPELKRIIVAFGDHIVMRDTLENAIYSVLGEEAPATATPASTAITPALPSEVKSALEAARQHLEKAREDSRQGDWAGYGSELKKLNEILNRGAAKTLKNSE